MKVRQLKTSDADQTSAALFFEALLGFYDVSSLGNALDMFARDGALTVSKYYKAVGGKLHLWELGEEHRAALKDRKYRAAVQIGCSYNGIDNCEEQFGLIVVDSPQGMHKDCTDNLHAEHFDVVEMLGPIMDDRCIVVLYVNKSPYDKNEVGSNGYDEYEEYDFDNWMKRRERFYQWNPRQLTEEAALKAYRRVFDKQGFDVKSQLMVPCHSDVDGKEPYAFRLALELVRVDPSLS